jgi:putative methionine-R-sulfoxide reductase with GAF domain
VIPVEADGRVVAVLDIDSVEFDAFSSSDVEALKPLIEAIEASWNQWEA